MNKFTISLTLTITPYITRSDVWDLYRHIPRPTSEEAGHPARLTYNEAMEYIYRRRMTGLDCGLPTLTQLVQGGVTATHQEWTRGLRYFARGYTGNLYTAVLLNPDGTTSEERGDNHRAVFRLLIGQHLLGAPELHLEQEYRERWDASRRAAFGPKVVK